MGKRTEAQAQPSSSAKNKTTTSSGVGAWLTHNHNIPQWQGHVSKLGVGDNTKWKHHRREAGHRGMQNTGPKINIGTTGRGRSVTGNQWGVESQAERGGTRVQQQVVQPDNSWRNEKIRHREAGNKNG